MTVQNEKGPAAIAVAPSRGSTNPTKDQEMNKANDITGAVKAPAPKLTNEQIADATADLETSIVDLKLMASIASEMINRFFNHSKLDANANGIITMRYATWERDRILFAASDVEFRSRSLNEAYLLARYGEVQS